MLRRHDDLHRRARRRASPHWPRVSVTGSVRTPLHSTTLVGKPRISGSNSGAPRATAQGCHQGTCTKKKPSFPGGSTPVPRCRSASRSRTGPALMEQGRAGIEPRRRSSWVRGSTPGERPLGAAGNGAGPPRRACSAKSCTHDSIIRTGHYRNLTDSARRSRSARRSCATMTSSAALRDTRDSESAALQPAVRHELAISSERLLARESRHDAGRSTWWRARSIPARPRASVVTDPLAPASGGAVSRWIADTDFKDDGSLTVLLVGKLGFDAWPSHHGGRGSCADVLARTPRSAAVVKGRRSSASRPQRLERLAQSRARTGSRVRTSRRDRPPGRICATSSTKPADVAIPPRPAATSA
jgi:hypothetical protein